MPPKKKVAPREGMSSDLLAAKNFVYPSRPAASFEKRWAAIRELLAAEFGHDRRPFSLLDLGSGTGYFSLQAATHFPKAQVVAIEGAVGVGNHCEQGLLGVEDDFSGEIPPTIAKSGGVVDMLEHISMLELTNCRIAPELWTADHVKDQAENGELRVDCLLALSVVHDIERISRDADEHFAPDPERCVEILADLMMIATPGIFVVEMPPAIKYYAADGAYWLDVYETHGSPRAVLVAAAKKAFGDDGSFSIDDLGKDAEYDGRETFVVRGINAEVTLFGNFPVLMTGPGSMQVMPSKVYPQHWLSREADFKKRAWCFVELAQDSEEFLNLNAIASTAARLYAAFRLENKMAWERYAKERDTIEKVWAGKAHPKRANVNMQPAQTTANLAKYMGISEKAGEMLLGHGNRNNQLASIGEKGLSVMYCGSSQLYLANHFSMNRNSYTSQDYNGSVLNAQLSNNVVPAAAAAPGQKRKGRKGGSWCVSSKINFNGVQCRYTFLCRVLVDKATSNSNQVLTFNQDAHVYPEYLMVTD